MKYQKLYILLFALILSLVSASTQAADPPHDDTNFTDCDACHTDPRSPMGQIDTVAGSTNLCFSCHTIGGLATTKAFDTVTQASVGTSGDSHRWDSATLAYVRILDDQDGTGLIGTSGSSSATQARVVTGTVTTGGNAGTAQFSWTDNLGGSGSGTMQSSVSVGDGLSLTFRDDPAAGGTSFPAGMTFEVHTEPLGTPTDPLVAAGLLEGKASCTSCHDQHVNTYPPFLQLDTDSSELCATCHGERVMGTLADDPANVGHHPTSVAIPASSEFSATSLPLMDPNTPGDSSDDMVGCLTCHDVHGFESSSTGSDDGRLLRTDYDSALCMDCHDLQEHQGHSCLDCHTSHQTTNVMLVKEEIDGQPISLTSLDPGAFTSGDPSYDGICETCHTATAYHRSDASGDHTHYTEQACSNCHVHRNSFAVQGSDCLACHSSEMRATPDTTTPRRAIGPEFSSELGHHPFAYDSSGDLTDPAVNNCLICHLEDSYEDATHGNGTVDLDPDPDGSGSSEWQTMPGDIQSWCVDCHDGDNPNLSHRLNGQVASDKSFMATDSTHTEAWPASGAVFSGLCNSCHLNAHTARVQFFSPFYNDGHEEEACYGCHGGASNVRSTEDNLYMENMKVAYPGSGSILPRSRHLEAEMTVGDGQVGCRECHDPHRLDHLSNMLCDPDDPTTSWGTDVNDAWCLTCHDGTQAAPPVHADFDPTGHTCTECHLSHASTNPSLGLIEELSTVTVDVTPNPATVPLPGYQQFDPQLTPAVWYLGQDTRQRFAEWGIEGLTGGSPGSVFHVDANIPLDRTEGYDPSGWGLISVTSQTTITGGPTNVEDVNLFMNVPHHYRGDLEIWLRNVTTGEEAQITASNWSDGTPNLIQTFNSESPVPAWTGALADAGNTSSGIVRAYIDRTGYTGPAGGIVYTFTITADGNSGVATYDWSDTNGGSGSGVLTSANATDLGNGVLVRFYNNYYGSSPQFRTGDTWTYKPLQHWRTVANMDVFRERNANATWEVELHDTWPSDNPTDPASPSFCEWDSWDLVFNAGLIGTISETGMFQSQYVGTGNVYATLHHGRIWPIQSGLSDAVFEDPLPITSQTSVTVSNTKTGVEKADVGNAPITVTTGPSKVLSPVAQERLNTWKAKVLKKLPKDLQSDPHAVVAESGASCVECHYQLSNGAMP